MNYKLLYSLFFSLIFFTTIDARTTKVTGRTTPHTFKIPQAVSQINAMASSITPPTTLPTKLQTPTTVTTKGTTPITITYGDGTHETTGYANGGSREVTYSKNSQGKITRTATTTKGSTSKDTSTLNKNDEVTTYNTVTRTTTLSSSGLHTDNTDITLNQTATTDSDGKTNLSGGTVVFNRDASIGLNDGYSSSITTTGGTRNIDIDQDSFSSDTTKGADSREITAGVANPAGETGYNASINDERMTRTVQATKGATKGTGTYSATTVGNHGGTKNVAASTGSFYSSTDDTKDTRNVTAGSADDTADTGYYATTTSNEEGSTAQRTVDATRGTDGMGTGGGTYSATTTNQYGGKKTIDATMTTGDTDTGSFYSSKQGSGNAKVNSRTVTAGAADDTADTGFYATTTLNSGGSRTVHAEKGATKGTGSYSASTTSQYGANKDLAVSADSFSSTFTGSQASVIDSRTVTAGAASAAVGETGYNATTTSNENTTAQRTVHATKGATQGTGSYYANTIGKNGNTLTVNYDGAGATAVKSVIYTPDGQTTGGTITGTPGEFEYTPPATDGAAETPVAITPQIVSTITGITTTPDLRANLAKPTQASVESRASAAGYSKPAAPTPIVSSSSSTEDTTAEGISN